ncbi:hypothetical protein SKAU_G00285980 [Synaphobranchus kaupii]|uniref:Uncharacterized protein n=1 Tax=Synaphobranchus kaupii TaxID=118154 RepID=A0A9Q1IMC1_SYNKA|nr:hypothetical protein SKAU_G00285980 [Synaphobranchus kaupii]
MTTAADDVLRRQMVDALPEVTRYKFRYRKRENIKNLIIHVQVPRLFSKICQRKKLTVFLCRGRSAPHIRDDLSCPPHPSILRHFSPDGMLRRTARAGQQHRQQGGAGWT